MTAIVSNRIYDRPSPQAVKPYISIGPEDWQNADGVGLLSHAGAVQIDVWSVVPGRTEAKQIANAVQDALHVKTSRLRPTIWCCSCIASLATSPRRTASPRTRRWISARSPKSPDRSKRE